VGIMPRAVEVVDDAPQYGGREAFLLGGMAEQRERAPGLGVDALVREQWCCLAGQGLDLGRPAHGSVHLGQLDGEQDTSVTELTDPCTCAFTMFAMGSRLMTKPTSAAFHVPGTSVD